MGIITSYVIITGIVDGDIDGATAKIAFVDTPYTCWYY